MPYRRRRRRSSMAGITQSYKKVLDFAPASIGAGKINYLLVTGTDSVAAGQTSVTDSQVPTGARIMSFTVIFGASQIVGGSVFCYTSFQRLLVSQGTVDPRTVGGNAQRNQVLHQDMFSIGINQNANRVYHFKVPKGMQRVREGAAWHFVVNGTNTLTQAVQVIYKFYR